MSLKPGDMNCRIAISYVQSGRGPLGEPLPEKQVESGKAWAKRELVSGRKVRALDQQQVVETCLFTVYPGDRNAADLQPGTLLDGRTWSLW